MKRAFIVTLDTSDTDFLAVADDLKEYLLKGGWDTLSVMPYRVPPETTLVPPPAQPTQPLQPRNI